VCVCVCACVCVRVRARTSMCAYVRPCAGMRINVAGWCDKGGQLSAHEGLV